MAGRCGAHAHGDGLLAKVVAILHAEVVALLGADPDRLQPVQHADTPKALISSHEAQKTVCGGPR